jgi:hypothetical protein
MKESMMGRWQEFRPSKGLWFWSCVGSAVLTIIVGFWAGGWTTSGTAQRMARDAGESARAQLVANACVNNFASGPEFAARLTALKSLSAWERFNRLKDKGWVTLAGMDEPLSPAASICADELVKMGSAASAKGNSESSS